MVRTLGHLRIRWRGPPSNNVTQISLSRVYNNRYMGGDSLNRVPYDDKIGYVSGVTSAGIFLIQLPGVNVQLCTVVVQFYCTLNRTVQHMQRSVHWRQSSGRDVSQFIIKLILVLDLLESYLSQNTITRNFSLISYFLSRQLHIT